MKRRATAAVSPLLLAAVAGVQLWLVHARGLTPWCGGGFGMFSTVDGWGARHLHASLRGDGWRREVEVPRELGELRLRALALPDATRLAALARELVARDDGSLGPPQRVEILVLARRFARDDLTPEGVTVASLEMAVR